MRAWLLRLVGLSVLAAGGITALSLSWGQERPPVPAPASAPHPVAVENARLKRDLSRFTVFQRQVYLSAHRGAEWLQRANRVDGRFQHGVVPALRRPLEGDHYLRQAGAALALAQAARFFQDDRAGALARQAVLTLLLDTEKDPQNPQVRRTTFPPGAVSRLGAAGLLIAAIHELPAPGDDLLAQAEELCAYIHQRQRTDGCLSDTDPAAGARAGGASRTAESLYAGLALYGLLRSQQNHPAGWKLEVARKARAYYQACWRADKQMAPVPALTAAFAEAYVLSREQAFADFVFEISDWLCTLQYDQINPRQIAWLGGFMGWADGRPATLPPDIGSASCAEALAEACRVARVVGDIQRHPRYQQALEKALQFVMTLQYVEGNCQHFAEWYRPEILGGFFASGQDGTLRIDYNEHAVGALVQYLEQ
jgi:hypothetical protein